MINTGHQRQPIRQWRFLPSLVVHALATVWYGTQERWWSLNMIRGPSPHTLPFAQVMRMAPGLPPLASPDAPRARLGAPHAAALMLLVGAAALMSLVGTAAKPERMLGLQQQTATHVRSATAAPRTADLRRTLLRSATRPEVVADPSDAAQSRSSRTHPQEGPQWAGVLHRTAGVAPILGFLGLLVAAIQRLAGLHRQKVCVCACA